MSPAVQRAAPPLNAIEIASSLKPRRTKRNLEDFLLWPADLFSLTSLILYTTEAYRYVVSPPDKAAAGRACVWPPRREPLAKHVLRVQKAADAWRRNLDRILPPPTRVPPRAALAKAIPRAVRLEWTKLLENMTPRPYKGNVQELLTQGRNWDAVCALVTLHAIADEVFFGFDELGLDKYPEARQENFKFFAAIWFKEHHTFAFIDPSRGRVLPKQHTPDVGLSLRSMSSHIAYHRSAIDVKWEFNRKATAHSPAAERRINCLLLPWPLRVRTTDFTPSPERSIKLATGHRFFTFDPNVGAGDLQLKTYFARSLEAAKSEVGHVDMVVLPEASLEYSSDPASGVQILKEELAKEKVDFFVSGFREAPPNASSFGENGLVMGVLEEERGTRQYGVDLRQYKHHRWILDRGQIHAYQLGSVLSPGTKWIEDMQIWPRKVTILDLFGITLCPLICEDLARQDPVANLLRAVGPTLILAILMDGPQYRERWASMYASVLADDPGSAVLTLTSAGMVRRWTSRGRGEPRRVIALWKGRDGHASEIEIEDDSYGVVLSLCIEHRSKVCADGRKSRSDSAEVTLFGVQQVKPIGVSP